MTEAWCDKILLAIPSINGGALLARMLPTLRFKPSNVVVLDQGSTDDTARVCAEAGVELVQLGQPHSYTQGCNIAARLARERSFPFVCVANNDITFRTDVLAELLAEMERDPRLGIVTPSQVIIDETLDEPVLSVRVSWNLEQVAFLHDVQPVDGAVRRLEADFCELTCALVRLSAIEEIGFLDDEYGFYHEDADFGFRLRRAGYGCAYLPASQIEHYSSSTMNREKLDRKTRYIERNKRYFARKHLGYAVRHTPAQDRAGRGHDALDHALHAYLRHYGMIEAEAPELLVSPVPVASPGYLLTTYEGDRIPGRWIDQGQACRAVFATSETMRRAFAAQGLADCLRLPLGIEPDIFHPWGPARRLHQAPSYLAFVHGQQSGPLRALLEAWQRFVAGGRDARLVLLGQGLRDVLGHPPDVALRAGPVEIARHEAARVEVHDLLAPLPAETLAPLYRGVEFTILAARGKAASLAALQSLACGVPCLVGQKGPVSELAVGGALGFAEAPADAGRLLACLEDSLRLDAAGRAALAEAGFYRVRNAATLRHTTMGLYEALTRLQDQDPAPVLGRLEAGPPATQAVAAGPAAVQLPPSVGRRLGPIAARRVRTMGRLVSQFGEVWQERGLGFAGRQVAGELGAFLTHRSGQVLRLGRSLSARLQPARQLAAPLRPGRAPLPDSALLIGYIDAQLGLGQSLRGLALALSRTETQFSIYPFGIGVEGRRTVPYMTERYDETKTHAVNVIEVMPDELPNVFRHVSADHFARSHNILRTYWELSRAPEAWRTPLERIDEIWAPNAFVAESFRTIFDRPITVVPPCVERPAPQLDGRRHFGLEEGQFHFLFSFDYFSFPQRKNPLGVVRAFRRAFPDPATPVRLIIKTTGHPDHFPKVRRQLRAAAQYDGRIEIIDESLTRDEMLSLIAATDCYVSLHRAEGFGFGMVEAMALGKVVIGTDYSGSTDFLSERTGYPVPYSLRPLADDDYVHAAGQVWAEPDEAASVEAMRRVFGHRDEAAARARAGRLLVEERYGPGNVGRIAAHRLREIFAARGVG
ncbi:glycosyltransferase [Roseomonas sp. OT10]|uniref:glycosyltransferase n=1 Tax=Roseomonas cutis TaxID=2897332 RepID=UPI001E41F435|nr:glycosyltransferase [Roseomonas sp. OT10]UFN48598.1 glycosyltransferase [Roseomonas sp. OT10]